MTLTVRAKFINDLMTILLQCLDLRQSCDTVEFTKHSMKILRHIL